jgi:hypothetical protein
MNKTKQQSSELEAVVRRIMDRQQKEVEALKPEVLGPKVERMLAKLRSCREPQNSDSTRN